MSRTEKPRHINLGRTPDHNPDRNSANGPTGATAATDIRPRDDSGDSRPRHSSKVCLAGIRG